MTPEAARAEVDVIGARAIGALEAIVKANLLFADGYRPIHDSARKLVAEWHAAVAIAKGNKPPGVPYAEFCRHPIQCAGKSTCPRDPTCAD